MTDRAQKSDPPPAATGSGSKANSHEINYQEITSMSVQQSSGLAAWYAALEATRSSSDVTGRGRHARIAPALDTTVMPASTPLPGVGPDPLGHVRAGDQDPDPSWQAADKSLCNALSPTVIPVASDTGETYTLRYACTRFPHPAHWQHIAADAERGVVEVWHGDHSFDTTVLAVADLVSAPADTGDVHQDDMVVTGEWPALDGDVVDDVDRSPADRVRHGQLTGEQRERLAAVLDVWNALRELGTHVPVPLVDALTQAEAALSLRAGA